MQNKKGYVDNLIHLRLTTLQVQKLKKEGKSGDEHTTTRNELALLFSIVTVSKLV